MVVSRTIIPFVALALAGCTLDTDPQSAVPKTGPFGVASPDAARIGGSDAGDKPSFGSGGAGSFPRSFLIPGTDTSIRLGG